MSPSSDAETLHRAAAGLAFLVGLGALVAPRRLLRLYGIDPAEVTGAAVFGWRLFAVRNVVVGAAALRGDRAARDAILVVQPPDQLVFVHALRSGAIPRPTAILAMVTSAAVAAMSLAARSRG